MGNLGPALAFRKHQEALFPKPRPALDRISQLCQGRLLAPVSAA